jgi:hypothetical protein
MKKTLLDIFKELKLDFTIAVVCPMSGGLIGKEFEITPSDFIQFAKSDLKEGTKKGLINSLTNCKRAIDCGIDKILQTFGIDLENQKNKDFASEIISKFTKPKSDLPYKLKLIESLGFTTGKILSDIRTTRNKLEHDYEYPKVQEVEDSIDIAKMFIDLIQAKFYIFESHFVISDENNEKDELSFENYCDISYDSETFEFKVWTSKNKTYNPHQLSVKGDYTYRFPDKEYLALIRMTNTIQDKIDLKDSFVYLLETIKHPLPKEHIKLKLN